jgi:hypothetical protein
MLFAGLAVSENARPFRKVRQTPVLERTHSEPFLRSATSVLVDSGRFRAWYVSARDWTTVGDQWYPRYVIRHAESPDGHNWSSNGPVCIDLQDEAEFGIGRPWVIRDGSLYRMWYSVRSRLAPYRIGYAESSDGLSWVRKDHEVGIAKSQADDWDSEMICYAAVIDAGGKRLMFYNGNRHGSTGFGYAILEG